MNFNPAGLVSNTSAHFDSNLVHRVLSSKRITFPLTIDTIVSFEQISSRNRRRTKLTFLALTIRDAIKEGMGRGGGGEGNNSIESHAFSFAVKNSKLLPSNLLFFLNVRISTVSIFCSRRSRDVIVATIPVKTAFKLRFRSQYRETAAREKRREKQNGSGACNIVKRI